MTLARHCVWNLGLDQGPSKTPKKGGFGQNWVNGLYHVKFNFQHDKSNFRAHWGHRTEIFSILVVILTKFPGEISDWYDGQFKFLAGNFFYGYIF